MSSCSIIPQIKNKQGELVDSKLFTDLLSVLGNREDAKTAYLATHTNEFKLWFGDWKNSPDTSSKVVDENGEPLMVYHGSGSTFDKFDKKKFSGVTAIDGFYFTSSKKEAQTFVPQISSDPFGIDMSDAEDAPGSAIYPVFLSIKNPQYTEYENTDMGYKEDTKIYKDLGYDGIIGGPIKITFEPNQIKAITNNGSFSKKSDNIYLQQQSQAKSSANADLNKRLEPILQKMGVTLKSVQQIRDSEGNILDANAVANLVNKSIEVVSGRATIDTLPEEASHFFVEILKQNGSPLYKSMMDEIVQYDLFNDTLAEYGDVYKGNLTKIKEEAIGKLIAAHIVGQFEQENKQERANTWWNRVLKYIKEKLGLVDQIDLRDAVMSTNPFSQAATDIFRNDRSFNFSYDNGSDKEFDQMYQLVDPKRIEDRIRDKYNMSINSNDRYEMDGKEVKNRVSDALRQDDTNKSRAQKEFETIQKNLGIAGHKDLNNIVQIVSAERDGKIGPSRVIETDSRTYDVLERYVRQMFDSIPSDAKVLTNVPIYDPKTDTGGTPNMIIVNPDGKVDILQWRFTTTGKDKVISEGRKSLWNKQLEKYRDILKNSYGITNFGKIRTIPIEANYQNSLLTSIRTGSQDFKTAEELNPVPISEELTGNEKLDKLIQSLVIRKAEVEKSRPTTSMTPVERADFNEKKYKDLNKITRAIRDIQLKQDIKQYTNIGLETISELASTPISDYSKDRLLELQKTMQFYGKNMLDLVGDSVKEMDETQRNEFNRLVTESQLYDSNIKAEIARRLISETGREDLTDPQKETGIWNRWMRTVSQQQHPIIKSFWDLVKNSKAKARKDIIELNDKIQSSIADLKKSTGKDGVDLFSFMLKKASNGKLNIISKYDSEFYNQLGTIREKLSNGSEAEKAIALKAIQKYTTFDQKAYDKAFADLQETVTRQYRFDEFKTEKISDRIKDFRKKYDNTYSGYSNPKNPFIKLNEDPAIYSADYKGIIADPTKKQFYDLWMQHSKEFQEYIGQDLGGRFVWNVHNNLVDSIAENGFGAFTNMGSILDHLEARPGEELGMVDPVTGKPTYEIPAYYTDERKTWNEKTKQWDYDIKNQSRDLGKVLSLVASMAYNHKYMQEIESTSKALELLMEGQESVLVDNNGNEVKNKLTNQIQKIVGSASTLDQFRDYINYYIYGVRDKTGDLTVKVGERNFSAMATFRLANKWFVGKALALNPVSIVSNIMGGDYNVRMIGAMDKFFNNKEYSNAIYKLLPFRDSKSYTLMGYFDLVDGQNFRKGAEALSTNFLSRYLTYDHLLIGQEAGDKIIRNGILLSMLQSHTYKDGKIVKALDGDVSLMDYVDTSGEKIDFKDITHETLEKFRNKVQAVGDNVLGNNSRDDIRAASLVVQGRALLTFRNWIPRMIESRYGSLTHNEELDTYELGRYKTFFNNVVNKKFLPLLLDGVKGFGFFGYGGKFGNTTINRAKELYAEYMEKNPQSKISEQEFIDLHLSNMRANMMEVYITGLVLAAIYAVAPDKDEKLENGSLRKWFAMQMDRNLSELTFFYSPPQFNKIIQSPVPIVNIYRDFYNLGKALVHKGEETVTGEPVKTAKRNELRKSAFKILPVLSGFESLYSFIDEDYDKTNSKSSDSKNK